MAIQTFPDGTAEGISIRGTPVSVPHPGATFWVGNSTTVAHHAPSAIQASDSAGFGTRQRPFATIDYAVGQCSAGRGDVIYVMPNHDETISGAAGVDFDVDGVTVIGLGRGASMPRLDFTATGSTVEVNADNVGIYNINFHSNISAVVIGLSVLTGSTDLVVEGCNFDVETTTTDEFVIAINLGVGCDRAIIRNNIIDQGLGGAAHAIKLVGATLGCTIDNNRIVGDYSVANIGGITTLSTEVYITNNMLINGSALGINAQPVIEMLTGTSGAIAGNYILSDVATLALTTVANTMVHFDNYHSDAVDVGSVGAQTSATLIAAADA